ncbi:MAG: nucleoside triphosphate pyrophosphohydrolase [Alphaproteobacteria bacterium]|nr:nucleoside triphosphate pyrophosphohydrolase [Alphaproteobacteria bacterium]
MKIKEQYTIDDLIEVMAALRNPDGGCPWDLEQDFKSIAPYTLEEAYEVADAIDRGNMDDLREELGDLLFQPIYHAQMASEEGAFDIHDVIHDVTHKMISRHPHVFGEEDARSASDVNAIWDKQKKAEKKTDASALDGVASALPSLLRAQKLQKKAAKIGFEWTEIEDIFAKLEEELAELKEACAKQDQDHMQEELGDVLFVVANIGRILGLNAEESLRRCNNKFIRRFQGMETDLKASEKTFNDLTLDEMLELWDKQKKKKISDAA